MSRSDTGATGWPCDLRLVLGIVILLIGIALLAERVFHGLAEGGVVLAVGIVFLVLWLLRGRYGQLVVGCLATAVGVGGVIDRSLTPAHAGSISLGCGFIAIYLLEEARTRRAHWWPLLPGVVLVAGGLLAEASVLRRYFWPVALVIVGLAIVSGEWRHRGSARRAGRDGGAAAGGRPAAEARAGRAAGPAAGRRPRRGRRHGGRRGRCNRRRR